MKTIITRNFYQYIVSFMLLICFSGACTPVHQNIKPRVLKPADQIANSKTLNGISVGVEHYVYSGQGLNYLEAGITPVQVTVSNNTSDELILSPDQVIASGSDGQLYLTYTPQEAAQLVIESAALREAAKGAAAGAVTGAALGAIVGLAIGAIFDVNTSDTAMAGAIGGGISGAGGGIATWVNRLQNAARQEINNNALRNSHIAPGFTIAGWLYLPSHVSYSELRIALSLGAGKAYRVFRITL